ncbi:response regulator [Altererythrobacter sp. B11]|uniref:response regulator n=1 Tax=Altererythrobacter sp. B11 TaxID=2060312 RepID=UPI000DC735C4|nr:response regulator [Altererythrobacter sp. B11]BBC72081.1 response regulator [Altererythrobacter sp. B11]
MGSDLQAGGKERADLGRVLVVEDDPVLALEIEEALLARGAAEVVICPTAACAMKALEAGTADAVVLDVHLGDCDAGWELAELVTMLGVRQPRIVFSTGSPEAIPPDIAAMGPVFEKPYDPATLADVLAGDNTKRGLFSLLRNARG